MSGSANLGLRLRFLGMLPPEQQSNEPLTPKQIAVVLENISSRQRDLQYIEKVTHEEETKSAANAAAIAHLEPAISRAKLAIAAQKQVLADLIKMKTKLDEVNCVVGPNWVEMSEAKELCEGAMTRVESQIKHGLEKFSGQISQFERNIPTLCKTLQEMELEIYSQRLMRDASIQHITDISVHKKAIEKNIKLLRSGLDPIKNTPAEIWAKIITLRVHEDTEAYFRNPGSQLMPSITLKLSQVCRFWRRVVFAERNLWQFTAIYPDSMWIPSKVELLKYSRTFNSAPPTLVYDTSRQVTWTRTPQHVGYNYNRNTISLDLDTISMFDTYSLQLLTYGHASYSSHPSSISFRQPKSLGIQIISATVPHYLANVLGPFSGLERLEISTQTNYTSAPQQLSTSQPQLTYLKLDLTTFQPFDIAGYLGPNLTEFHLKHNGANTLNPMRVRLPNLKVLGLTPPDTDFIQQLALPNLSKLILYGPKLLAIAPISLMQLANSPVFRKVRDFELRSWSVFKPSGGEEWGVMLPLNEVVEKIRSIVTLKCVDSYIDGSRLVGLVATLKDTVANAEGSTLGTVVIDTCSGITRDDCEVVAAIVDKTEVYV